MRLIILILALNIASSKIYSQVPDKFRYSTEIRVDNELIKSQIVELRISLLKDSVSGTIVYTEKQSLRTDDKGIANIVIGDSSTLSISSIDWGNKLFFIRVEADINSDGETDYLLTSQILSVPYAIHAQTADSIAGEINEQDPYYANSIASDISESDTANWNDLVRKHKHYIGELYGGGIVYWVTPDGQHGLIASKNDLIEGKKVKWDPRPNPQKSIIGAQSYYDGKRNTAAILADFRDNGYPATVCSQYKIDGYDDWYLPSNQELKLMLPAAFTINKVLSDDNNPNTYGLTLINKVGEYGRYWSSTEHATNAAWLAFFSQDKMDFDRKDTTARVRAIRSF